MGTVYADIVLTNAGDEIRVVDGHIKAEEIRQTRVTAMVDTGAGTLAINEAVCTALGLRIEGLRRAELADGAKQPYKITEPVKIQWKNRNTVCRALVLPNAGEVLLGAIPLEDMDLIVNPVSRELVGAHGDEVVCMVKYVGQGQI